MDRRYIDDHRLVARYLADQLPDAEREAFEAYYLEHPDVVQDMEATARLKVGLAQLQESGELHRLLQPPPWFRQHRYLAIAAGTAFLAMGTLLWFGNRPAPREPLLVASATALVDSSGHPLPIFATYPVLRTRSASYDATIKLPQAAQTIALRVLPEVDAVPPRYRVALSVIADDDSLREVATLGELSADEDGFVPVYFNSTSLVRGRYQLALSGDADTSAADELSSFLIRVVDGAP
ncbi:hypothetical protein [Povalibacter sp.]|uniref:hypothetical protein n=1 Tax=Povalibacter sp. TaxID=1962978 RepID=UPI002F3EC70B